MERSLEHIVKWKKQDVEQYIKYTIEGGNNEHISVFVYIRTKKF